LLRVYLVRHGETVWNREGRVQGHTDVPLSAAGVEQAKRMARRLANEKIDAVWSSDLGRARATAEAVAEPRGLAVVTTPLLRETMLGRWEGLTEPEVIAGGDGDLWRRWRHEPDMHRPPDSEPLEQVWSRMIQALGEIRREVREGTVVISGHGGSLRAILCDAIGAPLSSLNRFALENTSVSLIEYTERRTWVRYINDTCHLREARHA
jgi:broad specificity phosphatase PhoE